MIDSKSFFDPEKFFRSSGNSVPRAARALFGGWHNRRPGEDQSFCGKLLNWNFTENRPTGSNPAREGHLDPDFQFFWICLSFKRQSVSDTK